MADKPITNSPIKLIQSKVHDLWDRFLPKLPTSKLPETTDDSQSLAGDLSEALVQIDTPAKHQKSIPIGGESTYRQVADKMQEQLKKFEDAVTTRLGLEESLKTIGMSYVKEYFRAENAKETLNTDRAREILKPATDRQLRASSQGPSITFTFPSPTPDTRVTYTVGHPVSLTEHDAQIATSLSYRKPEQALEIAITEKNDEPPQVLFTKISQKHGREIALHAEAFIDGPTSLSDEPFQPLKITYLSNNTPVIAGDYTGIESSGDVHLTQIRARHPDDPLEWWFGNFDENTNTVEWTKHTKDGKHESLANPINVLHSTEVPGTMALFSGDKELGQIPIKPNVLEFIPIDIFPTKTPENHLPEPSDK